MIQLYEFTVLRFYRLLLTLQYIDTLRLYAFTILQQCTYPLEMWETTCLLSAPYLPIYGFTVNFVYGKFCKFTKFTVLVCFGFTLRKGHAQIVNLRIYRFVWLFSGTMEFTILRFDHVLPFYGAPWQNRRALDLRALLTQTP